jgi:hypothetical protein
MSDPVKYIVVGNHAVNGSRPGELVEITSAQAKSLVGSGHVKVYDPEHDDIKDYDAVVEPPKEEISEAAEAESDEPGHLPEVEESE